MFLLYGPRASRLGHKSLGKKHGFLTNQSAHRVLDIFYNTNTYINENKSSRILVLCDQFMYSRPCLT